QLCRSRPTRSRLADQRHCGAPGNRERHRIDGRERRRAEASPPDVVHLRDIAELDDGFAGTCRLGRLLGHDVETELTRLVAAIMGLDRGARTRGRLDALRCEARSSRHETLGVRMLRILQDLEGGPRLHDASAVHNYEVFGALCCEAE